MDRFILFSFTLVNKSFAIKPKYTQTVLGQSLKVFLLRELVPDLRKWEEIREPLLHFSPSKMKANGRRRLCFCQGA